MRHKYHIDLWKRPHDTPSRRWQANIKTENDELGAFGCSPYEVLANLTAYWFKKDHDEDRLKDEDIESKAWPAQSVTPPPA